MAITKTYVKPLQGQSPIILHNVPQSITVGDITGDKGTNEVWADTKGIEDFTATITTLDEYSTGVPYKKITVTSELDTSTKTWGEGVEETDEAEEKTFTIPYKGHERDFAIEIKDNKAYIRYRWGMNDSHDLSVEKNITITERPRPSEGEGSDEDDGDAWGYPRVSEKAFCYRVDIPEELRNHEYIGIMAKDNRDSALNIYKGEEIGFDDENYYVYSSSSTLYFKPSDWKYCLFENGDTIPTEYKVQIPSDEPRCTIECTSVTIDSSKNITLELGEEEQSVQLIPFPYKEGYAVLMMEGLFFKETLDAVSDGGSVCVSIPSTMDSLDGYEGISFTDCVLYIMGEQPLVDGAKLHYLFVDIKTETLKLGYFSDNGEWNPVEFPF